MDAKTCENCRYYNRINKIWGTCPNVPGFDCGKSNTCSKWEKIRGIKNE